MDLLKAYIYARTDLDHTTLEDFINFDITSLNKVLSDLSWSDSFTSMNDIEVKLSDQLKLPVVELTVDGDFVTNKIVTAEEHFKLFDVPNTYDELISLFE